MDCLENPTDPECQQIVDCLINPEDPSCPDVVDCTVTPNDPECAVDCTVTPNDPACQVDCTVTPNDPACQVDCTVTPNDPACAVDCTVTPNDPACAVDCTVTPNDPECAVDCTVTPNDPECAVDCTVTPNDPECVVDCTVTPNDPECAVDCTVTPNDPECDVRTPEEKAVDAIIDNWNTGETTHIGVALALMDFSNAFTLTQALNFEITEDIDETHMIDASITDSYVYNETVGTMIQRDVFFNMDDELEVEFTIYMIEVPTGVHIYLQPGMVFEAVAEDNPEILTILDTVGFNNEWAVFEFDDSLANVIQLEVLKEMIVTLFFNEMGEDFFDVLQADLEMQIGFGLEQYGVDIAQFIEYLIDEDFVNAELLLRGIQVENIILHADHMYVAWQLYDKLGQFTAELTAASFDVTKLELLNTATHDAVLDEMVVNLPIDPLDGTVAFFESLTPAEVDLLIEIVIKPTLEAMVYDSLLRDVNPDYLDNDFINILSNYEQFLIDNWPVASDPFVLADAVAYIQANGAFEFYKTLNQDEFSVIHWAVDHHNNSWVLHDLRSMTEHNEGYRWYYVRYEEELDLYWLQEDVRNFINSNITEITNLSYDPNQFLTDIDNQGIIDWYNTLDDPARQMLTTLVEQPGNEYARDQVWRLHGMWENPWEYQEFFRRNDEFINPMWVTDNLVNLISNHTTYLNDEYGIDGNQLVADIQMQGGIEWYLYYAGGDVKEALYEISGFDGDQNEGRYVIETMERVYENEWEYHWWFGRAREMHDPEQIHHEIMQFLQINEAYIVVTYSYDVQAWMNDVEMYGPIEWYNMLPEQSRTDLMQAAQYLDAIHESYSWAIHNLQHLYNNAEQYRWCYGEWNYCVDMDHLTEQLINFVESNAGMLESEFGLTIAEIVANIEMYGPMDWYMQLGDHERDTLWQIADQFEWQYEILWTFEDIQYQEEDLHNYLTTHATVLDGYGFNTTQMIADLEMYGIQVFVADYLSEADIEMLLDAYVYPIVEGLRTAIENDEIEEYVVQTLFTDPHILANFQGEPVVETAKFLENIVLIDFDALYVELETFDAFAVEALATAVYEGQAAFDIYLLGLDLTHPNLTLVLEPYRAGVLELEEVMYIIDDIEYILTMLEPTFQPYFTLDYYLDNNFVAMELVPTADFELITRFSLTDYTGLVEALLEDGYWFLHGIQALEVPFVDPINCPVLEDCEVMEGYDEVMANLDLLDPFIIDLQYDPTDLTNYSLTFNATELMDSIIQIDIDNLPSDYVYNEFDDRWTGVTNATFTVTMESGATITPPATADSVNDILTDFAKFSLVQSAYDVLKDVSMYYAENPGMVITDAGVQIPISSWDEDFLQFTMALDKDMSYTELTLAGLPPVPDFAIQFYWLDGTEVFDAPLSWSALGLLLIDDEIPGAADYQALVDMVDEANFNLTKLWLYYMMGNTGTPDQGDDFYE
ncbi:hypothetical protein OAO42_01140 [Candidatus Izimaplasma bacterium]|nr:hypothetical protein [Candidatus Izimaplasma bacterium]